MTERTQTGELSALLARFKFHTPIRIRFCEVEPTGPRLVAAARGGLVYFDHEGGRSTPLTPPIREAIGRFEGLPA